MTALFSSPAMAELFSPRAMVAVMLHVEGALARALARAGVVPAEAADAISAACNPELYDADAIFAETATAGTPVIPLVRMLGERVDEKARGWVHWGATSQDIADTAMVLQMHAGLELLVRDLHDVAAAAATLAERHRHTLMAGRTLLQQAAPITFGLKAARWLALTVRQMRALDAPLRTNALPMQFGGAVGTRAAFGDAGPRVEEFLAGELALSGSDLPWHAERDRIATVAAALGVAAGAMSKIAGDVALLSQTEVGELSEGAREGKGGSSAMPQKRNPVDAMSARAAARLAIALVPTLIAGDHEHERAAGAWQTEWVALPQLFCHTAGAVSHVRQLLAGLEVHEDRMRRNLELAGSTLMAEALTVAIAAKLGRHEAQRIVKAECERALRDGITLREAAVEDTCTAGVLSREEIDKALDPTRYLGSTDLFIDRALASFRGPR